MFLRPRRFGKSTFLYTLCDYYDIAGADIWKAVFEGLYIGKHPTVYRSTHLVLHLDLSSIVVGDMSVTKTNFHEYMNRQLANFLEKYRIYLQNMAPEGVINRNNGTDSLRGVLVHDP